MGSVSAADTAIWCEPYYNTTIDALNRGQYVFVRSVYPGNTVFSCCVNGLLIHAIISSSKLRKMRLNMHLVNVALSDAGCTLVVCIIYYTQYADDDTLPELKLSLTPTSHALVRIFFFFSCNAAYGIVALAADLYSTVVRTRIGTLFMKFRDGCNSLTSWRRTLSLILTAVAVAAFCTGYFCSPKIIMLTTNKLSDAKHKIVLALVLSHCLPALLLFTIQSVLKLRLARLMALSRAAIKQMSRSPFYMEKLCRRERSVRICAAFTVMHALSSVPMIVARAYFTYCIVRAPVNQVGCPQDAEILREQLSAAWIQWLFRVSLWILVFNSNLTMLLFMLTSRYFREAVKCAVLLKWNAITRRCKGVQAVISTPDHLFSFTDMSAAAFHGRCAGQCTCLASVRSSQQQMESIDRL